MKNLLLAASLACAFAAAAPRPAEESALSEKKDEYIKKARAELDSLGGRIDDLEAKARKTGAETRAELDRQLKDLKARRRAALKEFARLRKAGGAAWKDIKAGLERGIEDLKNELDETDMK